MPAGARVAIAVSRYNETITGRLLDAAARTLVAAGIDSSRLDVAWVPGAFELPLVADRLASTGDYAAVICLGAIIKGETTHDIHIAAAVAQGIEQSSRARGIPVLFGVLTCHSIAQAIARAGGPEGGDDSSNKGAECAAAAIEMISLLDHLATGRGETCR
ncbi:MAG: 6,7-dimethyl-8-ribityllumazine synthase [Planctomycetota bacterium]|nr:MAG: 6,7-dimethyl-8-ribityllumazine synthase [Planctomycetota bacterium]